MAGARHDILEQYDYQGFMWGKKYNPKELLEYVHNMEVFEDDVFVNCYAKSGTVWTQEMVYLIMNNADITKAKSINNYERIPFLEVLVEPSLQVKYDMLLKRPRILKTHLSIDNPIFPTQYAATRPKMVVTMRNPKDVMVSYYHFYQALEQFNYFKGSWSDFFNMFMPGDVYGGDWFDYTLGMWNYRNQDNILILKYEDMLKDHRGAIVKIAAFLGKEMTETQISDIMKHTTFNYMKTNKSTSLQIPGISMQLAFYRKGIVGDWKNYFTVAQNEYFDHVYAERMKGSDLTFDFE